MRRERRPAAPGPCRRPPSRPRPGGRRSADRRASSRWRRPDRRWRLRSPRRPRSQAPSPRKRERARPRRPGSAQARRRTRRRPPPRSRRRGRSPRSRRRSQPRGPLRPALHRAPGRRRRAGRGGGFRRDVLPHPVVDHRVLRDLRLGTPVLGAPVPVDRILAARLGRGRVVVPLLAGSGSGGGLGPPRLGLSRLASGLGGSWFGGRRRPGAGPGHRVGLSRRRAGNPGGLPVIRTERLVRDGLRRPGRLAPRHPSPLTRSADLHRRPPGCRQSKPPASSIFRSSY